MGSSNWISVRGVDKREILDRISFAETGKTTTLATMLRGATGVVEIPNGRVLLYYAGGMVFSPEMAAAASVGGDAIYGWDTEVVMASHASAYVNGVEVWSVDCDPGHHPELSGKGSLPESYRDHFDAAQAADYVYDVPLKLSAEFGYFRPDEDLFDPTGEMWLIEPTADFDAILKAETKRAAKEAARVARAERGGLLTRLFGLKK